MICPVRLTTTMSLCVSSERCDPSRLPQALLRFILHHTRSFGRDAEGRMKKRDSRLQISDIRRPYPLHTTASTSMISPWSPSRSSLSSSMVGSTRSILSCASRLSRMRNSLFSYSFHAPLAFRIVSKFRIRFDQWFL